MDHCGETDENLQCWVIKTMVQKPEVPFFLSALITKALAPTTGSWRITGTALL